VEVRFLDSLCLFGVAVEEAFDIGPHSLVDQLEKAGRCRIQAVIEIEDPVANVGVAAIHAAWSPIEFKGLSKSKGRSNHGPDAKPWIFNGLGPKIMPS
jgi:hypothetical protein